MSREIKFRAWDKYSKRMHSNVQSGVYEDPDDWTEFNTVLGLECFEVMQYTGLKDKNGKEIYEGDIVRVNKLTYETSGLLPENLLVKYYGGMFQFFRSENDCLMGLHLLYLDNGEVIGNIYEHKHLLEATA